MSMGLRNVCLLAGCSQDPLGRVTKGVSMQGASTGGSRESISRFWRSSGGAQWRQRQA